jgi:parallel beta-helix repeat protein
MIFTHKLSRRLAILRAITVLVGLSLAACTDEDPSDALGPPMDSPDLRLGDRAVALKILPDSVTLELQQAGHFEGYGITAKGDSVGVAIVWKATGGTITSDGAFSSDQVGTFKVIGKTSGKRERSDTAFVTVVPPQPSLVRIVLSPDTVTVPSGQTTTFSALGRLNDSSTAKIGVNWSASGGTIDEGGVYTAGSTPGKHRVIASSTTGMLADTSEVTIPAPEASLDELVLTPSSIALTSGATQQFQVYGRTATGDSIAAPAVYTGTGGSITPAGLYTAGATTGTFRVIAAQSGGTLADTATVTITAASTCTSMPTLLCPGDNIQTKATAAGPGATLILQPGIYRLQTITPLNNQTFQGQPGAIVSGARLLTGWTQDGSRWYVTGQTQQGRFHGQCEPNVPCQYPDDVYRDDVLLRRVLSLGAVVPGTFYFDYAADRIYVGDDPAGHQLEAAVTTWAFRGTASGVVVRGLVIEKYANPAQDGAIGQTGAGADWVIRDNEIRFNHGGGIRGGPRMVVAKNHVHHNGQIGLIGGGWARVDSNEIAYNNTARFDMGWEAGGTKFLWTEGMIARGNFSHHNRGPGLWWDADNNNALIEGNRLEDNHADGIFWEISYRAVIRDNVCLRNGFGRTPSREGGGILILASGATTGLLEVYGNTVVDNKEGIMVIHSDRGSGRLGSYRVQNVSVHDNTVQLLRGANHGLVRYSGTWDPWVASANNHFEHNTYNLQTADPAPFDWITGPTRTEAEWRGYGNDETGTFRR